MIHRKTDLDSDHSVFILTISEKIIRLINKTTDIESLKIDFEKILKTNVSFQCTYQLNNEVVTISFN